LLAAAVAVVGFGVYRATQPRIIVESVTRVDADMNAIRTQLKFYEKLTGDYPSTEQGLAALVHRPGDAPPTWRQLLAAVPTDPWGTPYIYRYPSTSGAKAFELVSRGPDRIASPDDIR
jgi:general secretion pathway protein G